jgi:hypothetical protein
VRSLRDPDPNPIRFDEVIETTVTALNGFSPDAVRAGDRRTRDGEFHVYQVVGRIVRVKCKHDLDIYIVLEDPDTPRDRSEPLQGTSSRFDLRSRRSHKRRNPMNPFLATS